MQKVNTIIYNKIKCIIYTDAKIMYGGIIFITINWFRDILPSIFFRGTHDGAYFKKIRRSQTAIIKSIGRSPITHHMSTILSTCPIHFSIITTAT